MHHSLNHLENQLKEKGSYLCLRSGDSLSELEKLIKEQKVSAVYWNRLYDPASIKHDTKIKKELKESGLEVKTFSGNMLMEPWSIKNTSDKPYQVFTPFWKKLKSTYKPERPLSKPSKISSNKNRPKSLKLEELGLLPAINWDREFYKKWKPGEENAKKSALKFIKNEINSYDELRDFPNKDATSLLAAPLHFGEISPKQIWHYVNLEIDKGGTNPEKAQAFLRQIAWREFSYQLLYHFPKTTLHPLKEEFKKFPWKKNKKNLTAWQKGLTGYPIVDAGMRQLWSTGTMHNRVRMVVASFLVKHLLIPWQEGAKWFWDTLVDADLANNTMGWQWVAGCGADAAPYFRVFNPILQGEKFDPDGDYVKTWIPELKDIPKKWIHKPWEADKEDLKKSGVTLGKNYPYPIIDHPDGRDQALDAYEEFKKIP